GSGDGLSQPLTGGATSGTGSTTGGATSGLGGSTAPGTATTATEPLATVPVDPADAASSAALKKPLEIGVVVYPDIKQFAALFGASGSPGDQRAEAQTAITWVNTHGGLNGHKVVPVFFEVELTSTQPYAQTYQQICQSFTVDHHVVATIFVGNAEPALPSCLAKRGSLFIAHGHYLRDARSYQGLQLTVTPNDAGSDRVARAMVTQMLANGLVKRGETLGLLVMDYDAPQRGRDLMTTLLKAQGILVASYTIPYPQSTQAIGDSAAVVQGAELNFAARGIKTVAFLCPGCASFFLGDAESQQYHPKYVVSSFDGVGGVKGQGHGKSLEGAIAVGWQPMQDVGSYSNPKELAKNTTHQLCRTIEKAHAVDDTSLFASEAFCGAVQDIYAAAKVNPVEPITGASLMAGFHRMGTSHAGAANFSTMLRADHRDGTASYKLMRYQAACDCFVYQPRLLPFS
ncbi:MAG: hypothetical protein JWM40_1368, partial [Frankiales bacterium]|nr:hypothetical protein [Frankiales bacterium]